MISFIWYFLGLIGAALMWREMILLGARSSGTTPMWCPTPRAIVFGILGGTAGPMLLVAWLSVAFAPWLDNRFKRLANWFARPVCKRDR